MIFRPAGIDEADAIAALHTASWQHAYRGIVADHFLDDGLLARRQAHWRQAMARVSDQDLVLVAQEALNTPLLGFVAMWCGQQDGYDGFIDNLHVTPSRHGRGLGRHLLAAAADHLQTHGWRSSYLWVLDKNRPAYGFYLRVGGVAAEHRVDEFGGLMMEETRMVWADMPNCPALRA